MCNDSRTKCDIGTFGCSVPPHLHHSRARLTESESADKRHRTAFMQIMVKQIGHTEMREIRADVIKTYKPQLTEEANMELFFTVFNDKEKNGASD